MATLNQITCGAQASGNTGIPDCFADPKLIKGMILTPVGFKIAAATIASGLLASLQTSVHAARASRIYPLLNFEALLNDSTEDPTRQSFGYGRSVMVREGNYSLQFQYLDGGLCLHKQLRNFNGSKWGAFLVDAEGTIIGTKSGDDLMAIPLDEFYAEPWRMASGSEQARYTLMMQFKPGYINEDIGFVQTKGEFDIFDDVKGLLNLKLTAVNALTAGAVKVKVEESCGGENIYDVHSGQLDEVSAWVAKNKVTGAAITITSVTPDATLKAFGLQLNASDTDYPTSDQDLTIELAAPSVLKAEPISLEGYEGANVLTLTV